MATCNGTVQAKDDASCKSVLGTLQGLGLCKASASSTSGASTASTSGASSSGGGGAGGSLGVGGNGGAGMGGGSSTASSASSSAGGPVIQSLAANPNPVTPTGTTITAVVTDTSGVQALTGGTLKDKVYGTSYGAFQTPGGQGTFTYAMTWSALYQANAISFPPGGSQQRVVTATFFDMQNRTASQDLTLTLECGSSTMGPCSAGCLDLTSDKNNCGACGNLCANSNVCKKDTFLACACQAGKCTDTIVTTLGGGSVSGSSCNAVCQSLGATCVTNTCPTLPMGGASSPQNQPISCSSTTPAPGACCCAQ
jgi:hypothetical protein